MELQHAGPHERVRRERVDAIAAAVDDQHIQASTGQEEGGRRAGSSGTDDHYVVAWS